MKNKSIYIIYDTVNCTPNGDPDTGEQRYNEITKKAVVTDLRIKRFGRDKLNVIGTPIYYFYDKKSIVSGGKKVSGAAARYNTFCKENNIKSDDSEAVLLDNFVDVRVLGGILTSEKNNAHVTGALQFDAENESINEVLLGKNLINRGITTIFPSSDENEQGSMGRDSYLRYGIFCIKGRFSATTAKINNEKDDDINLILTAIWDGMKTANSRSKYGHQPIACIVVNHPTIPVKNGFLGTVFNKIFLPFAIKSNKKLSDIYSRNDYEFDFTPLIDKINTNEVESVVIYCDDDAFAKKYFSNLPKTEVLNPFDTLISLSV